MPNWTPDQRLLASMEINRAHWRMLRELANKDHVGEFYAAYARYLTENNVISERREILVRMAKRVAELLGSKL